MNIAGLTTLADVYLSKKIIKNTIIIVANQYKGTIRIIRFTRKCSVFFETTLEIMKPLITKNISSPHPPVEGKLQCPAK
jgi:hypothetical protein